MTMEELKKEIHNWKFNRYKLVNLLVGGSSLLIYELVARPFYRPYIYSNHINDFHLADTLGNSLGTIAMIFILLFLLSHEKAKGKPVIILGIISLVIYEIAQPLLGKPIDIWDILATLVTGAICFMAFNLLVKEPSEEKAV
jgi:glycopeptide antibiotics resistance protein